MRDGMHLPPASVWLIGILFLAMILAFGYEAFRSLVAASLVESGSLEQALSAAFYTALCISPLFYLRKLYRDVFAGLTLTKTSGQQVSAAATFLYYIFRPLFSAAISALFVVLVFSCVQQFSIGHAGVNSDFVYFCCVSTALISIGTGAAVTRIEELAKSGHSFFRLPM